MILKRLVLKNFRCFKEKELEFNSKKIIIIGKNGSGKTSILEALFFLSLFKSFRTPVLQDLLYGSYSDEEEKSDIDNGKKHFFLSCQSFDEETEFPYDVSIGCEGRRKEIRINGKKPETRRKLFLKMPVFSITEDDLDLIKGEPSYRRTFFDQAIAYENPSFIEKLRDLKSSLLQRNALLKEIHEFEKKDKLSSLQCSLAPIARAPSRLHETLKAWTYEVWKKSCEVGEARGSYIEKVEARVSELSKEYLSGKIEIKIRYIEKREYSNTKFEEFWERASNWIEAEKALERTLFGAHLDDILIETDTKKKAKSYASRGQQKLVVFLLKFSQYLLFKQHHKQKGILLLDDFLTDFDQKNLETTLKIIESEDLQTILTSPHEPEGLFSHFSPSQIIRL